MPTRRLRWLTGALLSGVCVSLLASAMHPAFASGTDDALIMGGTEEPDPGPPYAMDVNADYIEPNLSDIYPDTTDTTTVLPTPEQFFPLPGFSQLTLGQSMVQGLQDLQTALAGEPVGTDTIVFGFSQSATIGTDELDEIANGTATDPPSPADLAFVFAGDPNNPDGGLLERFDGFYIPGINFAFNGATPDSAYPTDIYTNEYDGIADFPQYPQNLLADINAIMGVFYDHDYSDLTPTQVATAVVEAVSPGAGDTTYYFIPTQTLPLLDPLVQAGAPQWLVDLLTPDLRVLVDMGYGSIGSSFGEEYANLPTPAGLFEFVNPITVTSDLLTGAEQGVTAALVDCGLLPQSDMPDAYPFVPSLDPDLSISLGQPGETLTSELAGAIGSALYGLNIPDIVNGTSDAGDFITDMANAGFNSADLSTLAALFG
jgi:PE-PPE domain-containing protein